MELPFAPFLDRALMPTGDFVSDPFAAAAMRTRRSVQPMGGRQEGPASFVLSNYLPHVLSSLMGLPGRAVGAAGELQRTGDVYDPAPALETATMMVGMPGGKSGLGSGVRTPSTKTPRSIEAQIADLDKAIAEQRSWLADPFSSPDSKKVFQEGIDRLESIKSQLLGTPLPGTTLGSGGNTVKGSTAGALLGQQLPIAGLPQPQGIRAYHGSPYDFERFDMSRIGTGEGAQAYGHGLYFAGAEPTALSYKNAPRVTDMDWPIVGTDYKLPAWVARSAQTPRGLEEVRSNFVGRIAEQKEKLAGGDWNAAERLNNVTRIVEALDAIKGGAKLSKPGHMYEVNINARPEQFLDWDKPLAGQPKAVQDLWASQFKPTAGGPQRLDVPVDPSAGAFVPEAMQGASIYGAALRQHFPRLPSPEAASRATEVFREAGIPGIKYLDQGSRLAANDIPRLIGDVQRRIKYADEIGASAAAKQKLADELAGYQNQLSSGTSNYVLFRDDIIDILRKYGLAGGAALPPAIASFNQPEAVQ